MSDGEIRQGGCLCGIVRYEVRGAPFRTGLCHCADCRKVTGSSFLAYADWADGQFQYTGDVKTYDGRSFCPRCGSRLFSIGDHRVEIYLGTLDDAPSGIVPMVEGWIKRREAWLLPLDAEQHDEDIG
ncbi:GFA family protein [Devosia sp. YIM 151766]|uniref:GFA family protein n=1 Tax=Devosia sp. YIM 151766 TaxID=3017325 RepID=UPI00255CAB95|nr:GFA family protein [Devosia sp. YIM 151766]WIY54026.1 GFA family protein [Devosia sp. YIM 151766]